MAGPTPTPSVARRAPDLVALPALLVLAALMRLPDLATRGTWDGDQGHDMLVLRALVRDGVVPLLGPPTSIGDVHHGAWYYYLLGPAAVPSGGDAPLAVVGLIAAAGIAAVGVVWWLARTVGGPLAGAVAGIVMALSAAAIDESTFIWNPNLIALSSAVALAAAWRAWSGGDRRWWLVAAVGVAVTMQCHVLGIALLPVVAAPFVADARGRPMGRGVTLGIVAIFLAAYLPLVVNELTTGFSETRAALDYLAGGRDLGEAQTPALPIRFGIVGLRVVSWPLTGLVTAGAAAASIALVAVIAGSAWIWMRGRDRDGGRAAEPVARPSLVARWLGLGLLWSVAFLTVAAPSLAAVVPGLPNDHYHAFADPMVIVLVGLGLAALVRDLRRPTGAVLAGLVLVALIGWNLLHLPPAVHADGGFPAGAAAGARIDATLERAGVRREDAIRIRSLPDFKSTEAVAYPLARLGRSFVADTPKGLAPGSEVGPDGSPPTDVDLHGLVLLCDDLFRAAIGDPCGGPAETALAPETGGAWGDLLERFEAAPGRWVSVYGPRPAPAT
jgi:hypothetical protein